VIRGSLVIEPAPDGVPGLAAIFGETRPAAYGRIQLRAGEHLAKLQLRAQSVTRLKARRSPPLCVIARIVGGTTPFQRERTFRSRNGSDGSKRAHELPAFEHYRHGSDPVEHVHQGDTSASVTTSLSSPAPWEPALRLRAVGKTPADPV
jgi:hypothetical protein